MHRKPTAPLDILRKVGLEEKFLAEQIEGWIGNPQMGLQKLQSLGWKSFKAK